MPLNYLILFRIFCVLKACKISGYNYGLKTSQPIKGNKREKAVKE
jgi:hypothetical protein